MSSDARQRAYDAIEEAREAQMRLRKATEEVTIKYQELLEALDFGDEALEQRGQPEAKLNDGANSPEKKPTRFQQELHEGLVAAIEGCRKEVALGHAEIMKYESVAYADDPLDLPDAKPEKETYHIKDLTLYFDHGNVTITAKDAVVTRGGK